VTMIAATIPDFSNFIGYLRSFCFSAISFLLQVLNHGPGLGQVAPGDF
jgi:hypothetical protein